MANVTWQSASSGAWTTGSNWKNNAAPNTNDDAFITVGGKAYTVALATSSKAIDSLTINNASAGTITATSIVFGGASGTLQGFGTVTGVVSGSGAIITAMNGTLKLESNIDAATGLNFRIEDAGTSVLQIDGTLGNDNTFTFVGNTNDSFAYNNAGGIKENFVGLNVGSSTTTPTNFIDFMNHTVTITGGNTGVGTSGTISLSDGSVLTLNGITNSGTGWSVNTKGDGAGGTEVFLSSLACYVSGTLIATELGETAVEDLRHGDLVRTASGELRAVKWTGYRRLDLARHPEPRTIAPIRIQRDAFAAGQPRRDLLVSPGHAIFIDDVLIQARLLVNGATICREADFGMVTYYHIELESHDILLAEGLPAESYLDTGNRCIFENSGLPFTLYPDLTTTNGQIRRETESCAPFVTDQDRVRQVWMRLAERAMTMGFDLPETATTSDPGLRVELDGQHLKPMSTRTGHCVFVLPVTGTSARLVSRATIPSDSRPWDEDPRRLGVAVRRMTLRRGDNVEAIPLDNPDMNDGWWDVEGDTNTQWRWTSSVADLALKTGGPALLEICFGMLPSYPVAESFSVEVPPSVDHGRMVA